MKATEKAAAIEAIQHQPPAKFNPQVVDREVKNEIVFWLDDAPIKFHIFFLIGYGELGENLEMTFLGVNRFSGKPALVTWIGATEASLHEVKVNFLTREQFKYVLSQYPHEVSRLFENFTPENWQDFQNVTKPLNLAKKCIIVFRENNKGRVEIVIHYEKDRRYPVSGAVESIEYIETSKEKFEKWREENTLLDMVRCYEQLREGVLNCTYECWFHSEFDKRGFWENINTGVNGIVEDYNCIIMMNSSMFVCTNKLPKEDVDSVFNKIRTKYLKGYFKKGTFYLYC